MQKKMLNYRGSTGDDVSIKFVPAKGSKCVKAKFTTNTALLTPTKISTSTQTRNTSQTQTSKFTKDNHENKEENKGTSAMMKHREGEEEEEEEDVCRLCYRRAGTVSEKKLNSPWVKCSVEKCNYWVHTKCIGFWPKNEHDTSDLFRKFLTSVNFFCSPHHPNRTKTCPLRASNNTTSKTYPLRASNNTASKTYPLRASNK